MPDADDIAAPDEDMGLAEGDAPVDQLGGAGDHEERVAILLELRPLMRVGGVLDRERVQVELLLHAAQQRRLGLEQADPDDVVVFARPFAGFRDRDIGDAHAMDIDARGDHAVLMLLFLFERNGAGARFRRGGGGRPDFRD